MDPNPALWARTRTHTKYEKAVLLHAAEPNDYFRLKWRDLGSCKCFILLTIIT